jgi:hypothetical protein
LEKPPELLFTISVLVFEIRSLLSPNIIKVIKLMRMRQAGHITRKGDMKNAYKILAAKPEGKRPPGTPRVDGKIILERS